MTSALRFSGDVLILGKQTRKVHRDMKVLFVTRDKYPPFRPAATAIFNVELAARGHEIDWVMQASGSQPAEVIWYGNGKAFIAANNSGDSRFRRVLSHVYDLMNCLRVFRLIRQNRYDIVQVKDHYLPAIITLIACKLYKAPFCYWLAYPHAEESLYKAKEVSSRYPVYYLLRGHFFQWLLYRVIMRNSVHTFVQSEQMKSDIAEHGIRMCDMTAVPGSVNLENIPFERGQKEMPELDDMGSGAVLYLGTLSRVRHMDFLIRAFEKVLRACPSSKLYVLGKGDGPEDTEFLEEQTRQLNIADHVVFTGHIPMERAWEYIRRAAVCVSPYYPTMILNSTSPTKLIEYMAMARPSVGNDHPEQRLIIEQSGAGLCTKYEESAFADAIVSLLNDPELAEQMGRKGRKYVEQHRTNSVIADIVERQYLQICKKPNDRQAALQDN